MGAIIQTEYELPRIINEKCIECGKCIKFCGMNAINKQN
ncbi:MAG: 4Fe-4S binding protein [Prevotellaceae bacterium]|nr:4Fe-4S binding protein [Prevotellaceae bacterium]